MTTNRTNRTMLRPFALLIAGLPVLTALGQTNGVAINRDGAAPNPFAILDVQSNYPTTQKGVLIPRMTAAERNAIPAPAQGLTVYVTDNPNEGFWYYENAMWNRLMTGASWGLTGNAATNPGTAPGQNYLGTTDAQPLVFETNGTEYARLDLQGDFGIGVVNPVEKLDVQGAVKFNGTSVLNTPGTIRYTTYNAALPIAPFTAYNYSQHEGNINGLAGLAGWRKIENDYTEERGASYAAAGSPVSCGTGAVTLPIANASSNTNIVSPYTVVNTAGTVRYRHQYLFTPDQLNVELNQIFNNPAVTQGLCQGAQITHLAFNVLVNTGLKTGNWLISIKHSSQNALAGFDNSPDPAGRCFQAVGGQPSAGAGWKTYGPFATPFVWDGVRAIIIDVQAAVAAAGPAANATVQTRTGIPYVSTYSTWGAACAGTGLCPAGTWLACGTNGSASELPIVSFTTANNGVSTAPVGTNATGNYVHYHGALIAEHPGPGPNPPINWSTWTNPPNLYYAFKGPGTISALLGVYDDAIRLSDHVFDRHFDGRVMPEDAATHGNERNFNMTEMARYTEEHRHLPTIKGRSDWQTEGGFGLGDITNQLWVTTENQALYLTDLNQRLDGLSVLAGTGPIGSSEYEAAKTAIAAMTTLTEGEKAALVKGCQERLTTSTNR